jgi:tetratricopeptide (TPR) repeat protein
MSNLGLLYSLWNRPEQAAPLLERALQIELAQEGPLHPDTLALMHNIAGLYRRQGRMADAVAMHEQVIEAAAPLLGESAWQLGLFHVGLAQTRQAMRDFELAEAAYDTAIRILDGSLGSDNPRSLRAREMREALQVERAASL